MMNTQIEVGDRIAFRNLLGLREELLVEEVGDNIMRGRGIAVTRQQMIEIVERAS